MIQTGVHFLGSLSQTGGVYATTPTLRNINQGCSQRHTRQYQHTMDWTASEVLDYSQYCYSRCMLEFWHTHHQSDSMNQEHRPSLFCIVHCGRHHNKLARPIIIRMLTHMRNHPFYLVLTRFVIAILHSLTRTPK